jgi:hypothetical protein
MASSLCGMYGKQLQPPSANGTPPRNVTHPHSHWPSHPVPVQVRTDTQTYRETSYAHTTQIRSPPRTLASFMTMICARLWHCPDLVLFILRCFWPEESPSSHTGLAACPSTQGNSPKQSHSSPSQQGPGAETQLKSTLPILPWPLNHPVA